MKKTIIVVFAIFLASCSENKIAKNFGGTMTINLPKGQKLMNATWKGDNVWYLYRPMGANDVPAVSILQEESEHGIIEGTVKFVESK